LKDKGQSFKPISEETFDIFLRGEKKGLKFLTTWERGGRKTV
jgi:hypothetical protein